MLLQLYSQIYLHAKMAQLQSVTASSIRPKLCVSWSIKGYHIFKIRPHVAIDMNVCLEEMNPVDSMVMKVVMPTLFNITEELHHATTKHADARRPL